MNEKKGEVTQHQLNINSKFIFHKEYFLFKNSIFLHVYFGGNFRAKN